LVVVVVVVVEEEEEEEEEEEVVEAAVAPPDSQKALPRALQPQPLAVLVQREVHQLRGSSARFSVSP
jgi:hypothetical protein